MQLIRSARVTVQPTLDGWTPPAIMFVLAVALGWATAREPQLAVLVVVSPAAALLLVSPTTRVLTMVVGPIAVFGGQAELTPPKLAFLAAAAIAFAGSFLRSRSLTNTREYQLLRPMFYASASVLALAVISFLAAYIDGNPFQPWLRGISPYLLFAAAPFFALDAAMSLSSKKLRWLLVFAGFVGAIAFAVTWLHNRGIATLPITWFGFPTVLLPGGLIAYATAAALQGRRNAARWLLIAGATFALLASTGTRSALVLLGAPIGIVLATRRELGRRLARVVVALPFIVAVAGALLVLVIAHTHVNTHVLLDREKTLFTSGSRQDRSYLDRLSQGRAAYADFRSAKLFGIGPGVDIQWNNSFNVPQSTPTVDSPLGYLAKFGILGLGMLVVLVACYVSFFRRLRDPTGEFTARLALVGFGAIVLLWATLNVPFEDKALPVAMLLLLALAVTERLERS